MKNDTDLLSAYQQILSLSEQMIDLARNEKWDELIDMEITYLKAVEVVTSLSENSDAPISLQQQLTKILQTVLDNEKETKRLLQRRLNELSDLIKQESCKQLLHDTYGQFPTNNYEMELITTESK
ncbi:MULTISPECIES: flagella biosynthesis regulatory protein FliT [Xenorhabdus]|uniref:Flagellar protein FliT n=1 Tax=Xenorhabdus griffiniae TaxID=351672 RepID=A0ABY9XMM8_9GAMM|nr:MULTISPECIES: flagella biosynthesis regulatory protein FliT [Xenorhabdus]MBD1228771.1 flagella biosynthesis regulatory protein FliT [Xenorhabdus griffiniae]MBE8588403.1 flagella biosynthesis regulatory protein FliT [Xenorhabdus griffiniae]MBE8595294.1 flagella biosynthesis regulatory protein FliT [Xenorhabdus sp. BG5]MDC9604178.1 flagella biosynthesis regulatory protein FliT [Xenorhabdus griffiniae]WMV74079.1 flagella biosynthesis regulatory protein FliT [Xenorhabdus griffiniae]